MKEKESINVLDELNKGACMGIDAINFLFDKIESKDLKVILNKQCEEYQNILNRIAEIYPDYSKKEPHETNAINKAMTFWGIEMKTITDKSDSKVVELLLQGTNMGIIEGRKLLNHKCTDQEVEILIEKYITMQEDYYDILKEYL
ncbi:MAG: hypothetical protein HFI73_01610 [Bacilli bacterium]|jgi:hypothetical protein|nr:hypothetical protein [Bacilli bacterium]